MYNVFNIQLSRLALWLIPTMLRKGVLNAFALAAYVPLTNLHNNFMRFRAAKYKQIEQNYQTCYLEAFLNDRFDFVQRRIYIEDAETVEQVYLFQDEEDQPLHLFKDAEAQPVWLYLDSESLGDVANDFIVFVPADAGYDESEIIAMLATKISGRKYKIQPF